MVFTTHIFVFYFLPCVLVLYYGLPGIMQTSGCRPGSVSLARNLLLVAASYVFYGWWNPWFVLLMFAVTVLNYGAALVISRPGAGSTARLLGVTAAVAVSLGTLGFFKYFVFFQANLNHLLDWFGAEGVRVLNVVLPIGISFYTFHALSYTIDVYRGTAPPTRSLVDFACYIALYPQLVAGPIIRYNTVAGQLIDRSHTWEKFSSGTALFVLGFAKKILVANPLGQVADAAFGAQSLVAADAWFGAVAYAFQIYFDFSGYSDMAVGLGRMIGFEFLRNFDAPYGAESITDFWRRWHISLSTFLRDYLYIPLGGNRKGPRRTYVNLLVVMLLGGLWHGANWTFVAWGACHGSLLACERALGKQSLYHRLPRLVRVGITFALVLLGWVLFRSCTFGDAARYLGAMFGASTADAPGLLLAAQLYTPTSLVAMAAAAVLLACPIQAYDWSRTVTWPKALVIHPLFWASLAVMFSQSFNPFLYFQF
jgi:alginate O-acetyltransferase complex protein AlgI